MHEASNRITRRNLVSGLFRNMIKYIEESATNWQPRRNMRPPGAMPETLFIATCLRCGECKKACSNQCIKLLPETSGVGFGTPTISYERSGCDFCRQCIKACPTKALSEEYAMQAIGKAVLTKDKCIAYAGAICSQNCTTSCQTFNAIKINNRSLPEIDEDLCMGCGNCIHSCIIVPSAIEVSIIKHMESSNK